MHATIACLPESRKHVFVDRVASSAAGISALWVLATDRGISRIVLRRRAGGFSSWCLSIREELRSRRPDVTVRCGGALIESLRRELLVYFDGGLETFSTPLDHEFHGTPFQREVWRSLRRIDYGRTSTYGDVARGLKKPGAARAVGQANGRNPVPVVIPCHRVVAAGGALGGFTGGLPLKKALLRVEGHAL